MFESQKEKKMSVRRELSVLDPATRMDLIMLLYKAKQNTRPGYGDMHKAAKMLQDFIEAEYGYTFGYKFSDPSIFEVWDNQFQEDIERHDVLARVLDNSDIVVPDTQRYYTHVLKLRDPEGEFLLRTVSKRNLEKKFARKFDALYEDIQRHISR